MTRLMPAVLALVALLCLAAAADDAQAQTVANSVSEFSNFQGQDGWYYGYYRRSGDSGGYDPNTDFRQLPQNDPYAGTWSLDNTRFYTGMDADQQHGNARVSSRDDVEHWAIRRWVSDVSGEFTISGMTREDRKVGNGDDGTIAKILLNGTEIFSRDIAPEDQTALAYSLLANLKVGDVVDFVMQPGATDHYDCPFFTGTVSAVPEPTTFGILTVGAVALAARRRRR